MDDVSAFERQVATEVVGSVRPPRPVDTGAIVRAVTAGSSPRTHALFDAGRLVAAGALAFALGGVLLVAQPMPRQDADVAGGAIESDDPSASSEPTGRDFIDWGSKRIYYTPPARWLPFVQSDPEDLEPPFVRFGVHDVARVAPAACAATPRLLPVGPTVDELTEALANQTGLVRSGPVDVMIDGQPAERFVIYHQYPPGCPPGQSGGDGSVPIWADRDGTEFFLLDAGFTIVLVADVEGERLVFAACACGHGFHGPPEDVTMSGLEADADALVASMDIVDADPMRTAWVTGTIPWSGTPVGSPEVSVEDGVTRSRTYLWVDQGPLRMSDPRLTGTMSVTYNQDTHTLTDATGCSSVSSEGRTDVAPCQFTVHSGSQRIVNEEGSWEGTTMALARGSRNAGGTISDVIILTGSGAYEGLTAYLLFDLSKDPTTVLGVIFPGGMPPIATFE